MTHTVAISIINYRTGALTISCLQSVLADLGEIDARVVVVDNASNDGSAEEIERWIAQQPTPIPVELVHSAVNGGFSAGHNVGLSSVDAEFYLVLNSDALLRPGFFRAILDAARKAPRAGLFAPRLEGEDGTVQTSCFRFPGPTSELIRGASTGAITRALGRYDVSLGPAPDPSEIGWASFACILLRGTMIDAIGPMDEGYFLYFEDAEYCLRAHRAGWQIAMCPMPVPCTFGAAAARSRRSRAARKRMPAYYYASRTRFFYQAHGTVGLLLANLAWHVGHGIAQVRCLFGKRINPACEAEGRDIWTNVKLPLGPRHAPGE